MPIRLLLDTGDSISVEVVRGAAARQGYKNHPRPMPGEGLLFAFGRRTTLPDFTMDGVAFDLDLLVLDREPGYPCYRVVEVIRLDSGQARIPIMVSGTAAIELVAGDASRLGIGPGSRLYIDSTMR